MANPTPVVPDEPSTITPPGTSAPERSASRTMATAARSLTLPPGFVNSALTQTAADSPAVTRFNRINGVPPTASSTLSNTFTTPSSPTRSLPAVSTPPRDWSSWRAKIDIDYYDERWQRLAARGGNPHGEADLIAAYAPRTVLDAGCGTGRLAIELARRGVEVLGVDVDPDMIAAARAKAPELDWLDADLAELDRSERFDVVALAGNVVPYVPAERRSAAVGACARHLALGGRLVAGFHMQPGWPTTADYDEWCAAAGLQLEDRWATWERAPYQGGDYAVSVHRAAG
jgi:hypothetical protein